MGQGQSSEFEAFLRQQRADADEKANIDRIDRSGPVDRAIAFIDVLQGNVDGQEGEIRMMKGSLRVFDWQRSLERIRLRAGDHELVVEVADDDGNVAVSLKRHPREAGKRAERELVEVPEWTEVIDVSKARAEAIRKRATELLINFFKKAYG